MKRIIYILSIFLIATSCKDMASLQVDPKRPTTVPAETLFSNAQRNLCDQMVNTNVNRNVFRLFSQYWTETTYFDESRYDVITRAIPDNHWGVLYRDVLNNFKASTTAISASTTVTADEAAIKKNKLAVIEILNVYTYQVLVNTFGNIPYTESLDFNKPNPKYDDAKTVYVDLLKRLDAAMASISASSDGFGSADLMYGGDMGGWLKFANSLKLRMGMILADTDTATAKAAIESASAGVFTSNADNAKIKYNSATPSTNPLWVDLIQSGRHDFVPANTIVDMMNGLNDPRMSAYFTQLGGKYIGGLYGTSNSYTNYSQIGSRMTTPNFEGTIMDYSEVEFLLAEAKERGFTVSGSAATHYNNAITASIKYWGGSDADASAYLGNSKVAYGTATGDYKQKIGTQQWLAFYNRGFEGWTSWRRLDFPKLNVPTGLTYADIPVRFSYPVNEQTLNGANYTTAAAAVGGDKLSTKLFWDKF